jgi:tryptophan synthase alpha chain
MKSPNRIEKKFQDLKTAKKCGFIAYITAGDPHLNATPGLVATLEKSGVDIVELGVPFSDPLADAATIQAAASRAIDAGASVAGVLESIRVIRKTSEIPIVLFTYLNPVYTYGFERFHQDASAAGADGILILDLPPDEAARNEELMKSHGLLSIRLIAPTTPPERMELIAKSAEGFIYYVSREGVTGMQSTVSTSIGEMTDRIRRHSPLPIAVGFGISNPAQAREVATHAEAIVVGSAIVNRIAEHGLDPSMPATVGAFVRSLSEAVRSV